MLWEIEKGWSDGRLYDGAGKRWFSCQRLGDLTVTMEKAVACGDKVLVALVADNSVASIACYLAALRCGHAVLLLSSHGDPGLHETLFERYQPEIVLFPEGMGLPSGYASHSLDEGFACAVATHSPGESIHPDLAVLLTTSGSTGNPKLVRLSRRNIQSNAEAIAAYLELDSTEIGITSLPLSYSYGLSLLNSHLAAGGSLACTDASLLTREFWQMFNDCHCTSFAGVPYSYLMLERLRFDRMTLPSLRTMTQAGGRLATEKVLQFAELAGNSGRRFFTMYGQTEATARIAYLPWERLPEKAGSVGIAIPGGTLRISDVELGAAGLGETGEILYLGPNVMMGYAERRSDLARGDELGGVLATGDIGYQDTEGYLFITGRLKRFLKLFGLRLNMDDIELMLELALSVPVACVGRDDQLHLVLESTKSELFQECRQRISSLYHIHHSALKLHLATSIPLTAAGKKDYPHIERELKLHEGP